MDRIDISYIKFFIKIYLIGTLRSLLLFFLGGRVNKKNWENRVLIIYLEGIGDTVVLSSVLKHFKDGFGGKEVYLIIKKEHGLAGALSSFVHRVIEIDYKTFTKNPQYGLRFVNLLRQIGFETVIEFDHSPAELAGNQIAVLLKAKKVIGYEGFHMAHTLPFDRNMKNNVKYVTKRLHSRFTLVIPSIDKDDKPEDFMKNVILHFKELYSKVVTNHDKSDYATLLNLQPKAVKAVDELLKQDGLFDTHFAVIGLGSSMTWKNWPVERFAEVSEIFHKKNIPVVLIGSGGDKVLGETFEKIYTGKCINLIGKITILDTISLINRALLVLTNDTAPVHIAIALKKPMLCIIGNGHLGKLSLYGYEDINKWCYTKSTCFKDNWRCTHKARSGDPTECIAAVGVQQVSLELENLLAYIAKNKSYPNVPFKITYSGARGTIPNN